MELNRIGPTAVWRVRRQFVQGYLFRIRMYVYVYIYIYGTFGDSASVGCNENEGRGYKAPGRDEARGACEY